MIQEYDNEIFYDGEGRGAKNRRLIVGKQLKKKVTNQSLWA